MKAVAEVLEVNREEVLAVLERARHEPLDAAGYQKLQDLLRAFSYLADLIGEKDTTISQLRALLDKPSTERINKVLEQAGLETPTSKRPPPDRSQKPKPGHGRNGAKAYGGAERIRISHASLKSGDPCPGCRKGKIYARQEPALRIRVVGQAPVAATVYELEVLRCNLCGEVYTAEAPEGVGEKKYDESAAAMIGLLKYGSGVPFYRLAGLEGNLGIPLPASTQWEIVAEAAEVIRPAFEELIRQAAQGEVLYNDDTGMKILSLARAGPGGVEGEEKQSNGRERTGQFTSGIVSTRQGQRIALFFTGRRHAGRTWARCWRAGPPDCLRRCKCVMDCRATCQSCRRSCKSLWGIAPRMLAGALWRWCPIFPRNAGMCWRAWPRCMAMMPRLRNAVSHRRSGCAFIKSTANRSWRNCMPGSTLSLRRRKSSRIPVWDQRLSTTQNIGIG